MLPALPQYMIALLKILLAAAPTSKAKTDSINIMTDVLPEEMPMTVMQSMKLGRTDDGFLCCYCCYPLKDLKQCLKFRKTLQHTGWAISSATTSG